MKDCLNLLWWAVDEEILSYADMWDLIVSKNRNNYNVLHEICNNATCENMTLFRDALVTYEGKQTARTDTGSVDCKKAILELLKTKANQHYTVMYHARCNSDRSMLYHLYMFVIYITNEREAPKIMRELDHPFYWNAASVHTLGENEFEDQRNSTGDSQDWKQEETSHESDEDESIKSDPTQSNVLPVPHESQYNRNTTYMTKDVDVSLSVQDLRLS